MLRIRPSAIGPLPRFPHIISNQSFATSASRSKSVIVTGAAQGIGRAIALQLAQDGYDVCVNDIASKKQALEELSHEITTTHHRRTMSYTADVTSSVGTDALVSASVAELGPLHAMVANAGIVRTAPILETTDADHEQLFAVNYFGVYNAHRSASQQFLRQGAPPEHPPVSHSPSPSKPVPSKGVYKLIAAASVAALRPGPFISAYSATKFAVRGLTQAFAQELAHHGITANCYAPGIVGTGMWDQLDREVGAIHNQETSASGEGEDKWKKGDVMRAAAERAVLGRVSVPEDVAGAVSWLASPGSDFVTGQCVVCDGGTFFT